MSILQRTERLENVILDCYYFLHTIRDQIGGRATVILRIFFSVGHSPVSLSGKAESTLSLIRAVDKIEFILLDRVRSNVA